MWELTSLPKAHLHVHLESTVRPGTLREIGEANGVTVPGEAPVFSGFRAFADYNSLIRACLRCPEDFERIAREFCEDEAAQGTRYAEVTFTAASHGERLGDLDRPLTSVLKGLKAGQAATGLECRVLLDHSRRRSIERARKTLDLARRHCSDGVIELGMAGEEKHSLTPFAAIFDEARDAACTWSTTRARTAVQRAFARHSTSGTPNGSAMASAPWRTRRWSPNSANAVSRWKSAPPRTSPSGSCRPSPSIRYPGWQPPGLWSRSTPTPPG